MKEAKKGTVRSKIKRGDTVVFIAGKEFNRYDKDGKRGGFRLPGASNRGGGSGGSGTGARSPLREPARTVIRYAQPAGVPRFTRSIRQASTNSLSLTSSSGSGSGRPSSCAITTRDCGGHPRG